MVKIRKDEYTTLTEGEVKSVLKRKFLRIRLGKRDYCFRVLQVKEIIDGRHCMLEVTRGFNEHENVYGFLYYDEGFIPVFDLDYKYEPGENANFEHFSVVVMDVMSNGLIMQLGIMVNHVHEIINATMSEMNEQMLSIRKKDTCVNICI